MMKTYKTRMHGLSLVELMIAMVLGLLITAAVVQLFLTNRQTYSLQQGVASVQEQGRFAVDFLSQEMMSAGYGNQGRAFALDANVGGGRGTDGSLHDTVRILFKIPSDNSVNIPDCSGGVLNQSSSEGFVAVATPWKAYSVNTDANGVAVLMCSDSDGSNNPVLDNVEAFQVLYGVSDSADSTIPSQYRTATQVRADGSAARVVSIRLGLLIASNDVAVSERSAARVLSQVLDQSITNGSDANQVDFNDGRLRRLFVSTVALRNTGS